MTPIQNTYTARARIKETYAGLEIRIPAKNRVGGVVFFSVWLFVWLIIELLAIKNIFDPSNDAHGPAAQEWLISWTFGGIMCLTFLILLLRQKEVITVEPGRLQISRPVPFSKREVYDLHRARNFCVLQPPSILNAPNRYKINKGSIYFVHDFQSLRFAWGLDEMEARFLLHLLLEKKLIAKEQLLPGTLF